MQVIMDFTFWRIVRSKVPRSSFLKCFYNKLAFPKGDQGIVSKVKVGEKGRSEGELQVKGMMKPPSTLWGSARFPPQQTLETPNDYPWCFLNHESWCSPWFWLYGTGMSRLAVGWGESRRILVRRLGNSQWVLVLGSDWFLSFIVWKLRELIAGHVFTFNIYSFHCTHRMPDTVLGSGNIMLTKTDKDHALDLRTHLGRQLVYLIWWLFNGSCEGCSKRKYIAFSESKSMEISFC